MGRKKTKANKQQDIFGSSVSSTLWPPDIFADFSLCILDTETLGLDPTQDALLEVAVAKCQTNLSNKLDIVAEFHSFVQYTDPIPDYVTAINHIKSSHVVNAPTPKEVMDELFSFINNDIVIAHNAVFDAAFLCKYDERFYTLKYADTLKISKHVLPGLKTAVPRDESQSMGAYKQSSLQKLFGIENVQQHSAIGDVRALVKLYRRLSGLLMCETCNEEEFFINKKDIKKQLKT